MNRFLLLFRISRPRWTPVIPLIGVGALLVSGASFTPLSLLHIGMLSLPYSIILYGLNDVYDKKSDVQNNRKPDRDLQAEDERLIHRTAGILSFLILGVSLMSWDVMAVGATVCMIIGAYAYSVPPLRFKERPPFDSITNGIGYVLLPTAVGASYGGGLTAVPVEILWVAFTVAGLHIYATIMDYTPDKTAGHRTVATMCGKRPTAIITTVIFAIIFIFSNIPVLSIQLFFLFCLVNAMITALHLDEALAYKQITAIYVAGLLTSIAFLYSYSAGRSLIEPIIASFLI